jgi:hypothetical protein
MARPPLHQADRYASGCSRFPCVHKLLLQHVQRSRLPDREVIVVGTGVYGIKSAAGPFLERRHRGGIEGCAHFWPHDVYPSWVRKPDSDHAQARADISDSSATATGITVYD